MIAPKWLDKRTVIAIHDEAIAMFGGIAGLRDDGLLGNALSHYRRAYVDRAALFDLAAGLCYALCTNRPFLDGNKRTALLSARAFLFRNGLAFEPREVDEVENLAAAEVGDMDENAFAGWFREFSSPLIATKR